MWNALLRNVESFGVNHIPAWLAGFAFLAFAVGLSFGIHNVAMWLARQALRDRYPQLRAILTRGRTPLLLALVVFAVSIALPLAPIDPGISDALGRLLHLAFIVLMGWFAVLCTLIFSEIYLRRFQLDAEDNLLARKHVTQIKILRQAADILIAIVTLGAALMTFDQVRQYGVSLFASAGVAGLAVGLAARPLLASLIAGVQLAVAQPIRLGDVVIVEGEYGVVEEITTTYVTLKLWDWRRMVVPLSYFIEKPFQNWTRETSALIGSVFLYLDYAAPIDALRDELARIAHDSPLCDERVVNLQVSDAKDRTIEVRALVSARNAGAAWDLRCDVREKLIRFLRENYPDALPRIRFDSLSAGKSPGLAPHDLVAADGRH